MKNYLVLIMLFVGCSTNSAERNSKYLNPECNAEIWNKGFETPEKDVVFYKKDIISHLPLKAGDQVADIGAGTGQFEKLLSEKVGPLGKIFAIEVAPSFIPYMKDRFQKEGLKNVEVVKGEADKTTLKESSVNLALIVDSYHHFDHPVKMVQDIHKILKGQGHLVILDYRKGPEARPWVNEHMHLTREDIIKEVTDNGFKFLREEKIPFKETFQLTFQKN